jgi:hypothetical protein
MLKSSIATLEQATTNRETPQKPQIEVIVSGLDSPRKLSFGPDGALYVAEAGRGGSGASIASASQPGAFVSYGATGAITRIKNGVAEQVVTGLPSLAGPDGSEAAGINDIRFDTTGNAYAVIGLGGNAIDRDNILKVPDFGQLIAIDKFDGGSAWTRLSDFGAYEQTNNPDGVVPDTNPYALLIRDNTVYVVDAGGNDLLSQRSFGSEPTVKAIFPARTTTDPLTGQEVTRQSVPTSVTVGPDGAFYVGELTGFPYQEGAARVYRVGADGKPEVYAEGFTNIVDLAFDKLGGLYVLEFDADGILNGSDTGALIYLAPDGKTRTTIAAKELTAPTGLAIGTHGDIYISNKGSVAGQGEVLRLSLNNELVNDHVDRCQPTLSADSDPTRYSSQHPQPTELKADIFDNTTFHPPHSNSIDTVMNNWNRPVDPVTGTIDDRINLGGLASTSQVQAVPQLSMAFEGANSYGITDLQSSESGLSGDRGVFDRSNNTSSIDPFESMTGMSSFKV